MFNYIALGDSITYGYGASTPQCAYPSLIMKRLKRLKPQANGMVIAEPGWNSQSLLDAVLLCS